VHDEAPSAEDTDWSEILALIPERNYLMLKAARLTARKREP
jgi:hypothetical protein